jgi:glucosylceramidase
MYWTEGGSDYKAPRYLTNWVHWGSAVSGILRNWSRCVMAWNLALDSKTGEITRSGQYWAFAHFSRAIRRGARRIESAGDVEGVSHVAFTNPDSTGAAVLSNAAADRKVILRLGEVEAEVHLPQDSVTTLTWRA